MDRRAFLGRTAFYTVAGAVLSACGSGSGDVDANGRFAFASGVASGDPTSNSVVFWTRCTRTDGSAADVALTLQVSDSPQFTQAVLVSLTATGTYDFTVRAKVTDLPAGTTLYYRFAAGADLSPVGTTRTAPAARADIAQLKFAWFTCQDWSVNHWGAMSLLAAEDLDFVIHVGDYVYETVPRTFQPGVAEPAHGPIVLPDGTTLADGTSSATSLNDYRTLYRTYRSDARLQAIHAKFPVIAIWDDHEFSDDCWQDHETYTNANRQDTARRRAANQAWVEYTAVDFGDVSFDANEPAYDNLSIYRDFRFGNLLHLVMTDERLYRDDHVVPEALVAQSLGHDPVNGNDSIGSRYFVPKPLLSQLEQQKTAALGRLPSILGPTQTQWWKSTLLGSTATWKVWGNEVMMNRLWLDLTRLAPAPYDQTYVVNCDAWDGYPSHKADLLGFLGAALIGNIVSITGDLHAFQCGRLRDNTGQGVLVDFVCAGISSTSFFKYISAGAAGTPLAALITSASAFDQLVVANNPDLAYADHDAQGYASAVVTADAMVVTYNKVKPLDPDGSAPTDPLLKRTRVTLTSGSTIPTVQDGV